jgi:hypothetical protein
MKFAKLLLAIIGIFGLSNVTGYAQCAYEKTLGLFPMNSTNYKIVATDDGGFVIGCGALTDTTDPLASSEFEISFCKFDSCGILNWQKSINYGESTVDDLTDIIVTPDSCFLLLGYAEFVPNGGLYNITIFKVNKEGQLIWKKFYGDRFSLAGSKLYYSPVTNLLYVGGIIQKGGYNSPVLMELDLEGNVIQQIDVPFNGRTNSVEGNVRSIFVHQDSSIQILVSYSDRDSLFLGKLDKDFNLLWCKKPFVQAYKALSAGYPFGCNYNSKTQRLSVLAYAQPQMFGEREPYYFELDSGGNITTSKSLVTFDGVYTSKQFSITPTYDGGYILGMPFLKLSKDLNTEWQKFFNETLEIFSYAQLRNGSYVGFGYKIKKTSSGIPFGPAYIVQTNSRGWLTDIPEQVIISSLNISPNPVNNILYINGIKEDCGVQLFNNLGVCVLRDRLSDFNNFLDVFSLSDGIYFLQINNEPVIKVVIEH